MNVDKVKLNNTNPRSFRQNNQNYKNNQLHFRGASVALSDITSEINNQMPKKLQTIYKMGSGGELRDIIINSFGTAFLAPIFIKWNPLSKTDEDTRTYSAWRQPVSAVLAVATQGLITIPFDKVVINMVNSGWFNDDHNKTAFKDRKYIEKLEKRNNPNISKEELTRKVDALLIQQNKELIDSIRYKDTITIQHALGKEATNISPEEMNKYKLATLEDLLKEEKEELKKFNETKIPQRIQRSEYYRLHGDRASNFLTDTQKEIAKVKDLKDINKILLSKEKALKGKTEDKELLSIIQELRGMLVYGKAEDAHNNINTKIDKIVKKHIPTYKNLPDKASVEKIVRENSDIVKRKEGLDTAIKQIEEFINKVKDKNSTLTVNEIEETIKNLLSDESKNSSRLEKYKDFAKLVSEKYTSTIEANIKGFKRISGLIVATAMLPVSCSLLNWVYPRFMDAVFPNLSNKKHSNEAHDYIDKANRNGEVTK